MATDNRTAGEKARDARDDDPRPTIETISLKDAMARKKSLEDADRAARAATNGNGHSTPTLGNGVPAELLQAAGGLAPPNPNAPYVTNITSNQFPVASPLTLIDQARNIQERLEHFARSLEGAAEWCEARAGGLPPLEAHALLFTARLLREDGGRCKEMPEPCPPDAEAEGTACTTAP